MGTNDLSVHVNYITLLDWSTCSGFTVFGLFSLFPITESLLFILQNLIQATIRPDDVRNFYLQMKGTPSLFNRNPVEVEARFTEQVAHGPAVTVSMVDSGEMYSTFSTAEIDLVACLHCPQWPQEAQEWATRNRRHGWPSSEMIDEITSAGFHIVPVPHHKSTNKDTEFRFSFSNAEKKTGSVLKHNSEKCLPAHEDLALPPPEASWGDFIISHEDLLAMAVRRNLFAHLEN